MYLGNSHIKQLKSHRLYRTRSTLNRRAMGNIQVVHSAYAERDYAKVEKRLGDFSGVLKLYIGACNNATFLVMMNALDAMKKHPIWRQRFHKAKGMFMKALKEWKAYEYQLLHAKDNRMFHLADYAPEVRKKYGDISDQEYYDYWCSIGSFAYDYSKDMLNSLKYKYQKALDASKVEGAEYLAEAMLAMTCLNCCETMLEVHLENGVEHVGIQRPILDRFFGDFSLKKVRDVWYQALKLTIPQLIDKDFDPDNERNIQIGIRQLAERWADEKMLYHAINDATEDYQEVFRTEGEWKKALRIIHEARKTL